jgi:hypothetical protein
VALLALATLPAGAASAGGAPRLQLTIHAEPDHARAGDDVLVRFVVANVGTGELVYQTVSGDACALALGGFDLHVTAANGSPAGDPAGRVGVLSCVGSEAHLAPGASFEVRISLQRRTGTLEPGEYHVTGSYRPVSPSASGATAELPAIESPEVPLSIAPRTDDEMGAYIQGLAAELGAAGAPGGDPRHDRERERDDLIRKLMYTRDPRMVPVVTDAIWAGPRFPPAARTALERYVPDQALARAALLEAAGTRGLVDDQVTVTLRNLGATEAELAPLIARALAADSFATWQAGAAAAMDCADQDPYAARLVAIARDRTNPARERALIALAWNRTEAGLAALRGALQDPDPGVREITAFAIRNVYLARRHPNGMGVGRPLLATDFDNTLLGGDTAGAEVLLFPSCLAQNGRASRVDLSASLRRPRRRPSSPDRPRRHPPDAGREEGPGWRLSRSRPCRDRAPGAPGRGRP